MGKVHGPRYLGELEAFKTDDSRGQKEGFNAANAHLMLRRCKVGGKHNGRRKGFYSEPFVMCKLYISEQEIEKGHGADEKDKE